MASRNMFVGALFLAVLLVAPVSAQQVLVLPGAGTGTSATAFNAAPLGVASTLNGPAGAFTAFVDPAGARYYLVSSSGLAVLDTTGAQVQSLLPMGQPAAAAALSPDGKRLVIVGGSDTAGFLYVFNTSGGTAAAVGTVNVGNNPYDVLISQDSKTAYVLISAGVVAVDLGANTAGAPTALQGLTTPGTAHPRIAQAPSGLIYVSASGAIYVIHPATLAVLATITISGYPTQLSFSPDGTMAAAGNQVSGNPLASIFDLSAGQVAAKLNTWGPQVQQFSSVTYVDSNRVVAISAGGNVPLVFDPNSPQSIRPISGNPTIPYTATAAAPWITAAGPKYLFLLSPSAVYSVDLTTADYTNTKATLPAPGNTIVFGNIANTTGVPASLVQQNATQSVAAGEMSLPLVIQVIDANGLALANQGVTWSATGVTLRNAMSATNSFGYATATAVGPATKSSYTITATLTGVSPALTAAFTLTVGASGGGGSGGGGGGGGTTHAGISIYAGNGQVVRGPGLFPGNEPLVVLVNDASGKPMQNEAVKFAVGGAGGVLSRDGRYEGQGQCTATAQGGLTCMTDSTGRASVFFTGPNVTESVQSWAESTVTATASGSGAPSGSVTFNLITVPASTFAGNQGPLPLVTTLAPALGTYQITGQAGQVLSGALKVQVNAQSGPEVGYAIQDVGLEVRSTYAFRLDDNPPARCVGGTVLTSKPASGNPRSGGVAACDLKLGSTPGIYSLYRVVGGNDPVVYTLTITQAPPVPTSVQATSGDAQNGPVGTRFPNPLVATVLDQFGKPMTNVAVTWSVVSGQATLSNQTKTTDAKGQTSANVTPTDAGAIQVSATAGTGSQAHAAVFNLTGNVVVTSVTPIDDADNQTAVASTQFSNPVGVVVKSDQGPVQGIPVTFQVSGNATLTAGSTINTDAHGVAATTVMAGSTAGSVTITATAAGTTVTFHLTVRSPGPQLTLDSFLNGASFQPGFAFGSVLTIKAEGLTYGLDLTAGSCLSGSGIGGALPTRVGGMEFVFGTTLAPIFAICKNADGTEQANVQAPFELAPGDVLVTVRSGAGTSNVILNSIGSVPVVNALPGIFTWDPGSGTVAVAQRPDGSYISPSNPAHPGEVVRVYVTGLGPVIPTVATNQPGVPGQVPFFTPTVQLGGVGMGGVTAEYAENLIGIFVVSFQVPAGQASGSIPIVAGVVTDKGNTVNSPASVISIQ